MTDEYLKQQLEININKQIQFKPINNFEDYQISDQGHVFNITTKKNLFMQSKFQMEHGKLIYIKIRNNINFQ